MTQNPKKSNKNGSLPPYKLLVKYLNNQLYLHTIFYYTTKS
jgi:hypothetical protein